MEIYNLYPGSFGSNCYLLISDGHAAVVDPSANADTVLEVLRRHGAVLEYVLLSHGHFDHVLALDDLRQKSGVDACIHTADAELLPDAHKNAFFTFFQDERTYLPAEKELTDGEILSLGKEQIRVLHTPGHTRGSVCYLCGEEFLLTGDTLFADGYGRFDLYGGDGKTLFDSLSGMRKLPRDLPIYPGHGAPSTLGAALDRIFL